MTPDFQRQLTNYADLAVRVGLNVQPGQRVLVHAPVQAAELVRVVTARAFAAGAESVDVLYEDDHVALERYRAAPDADLDRYPEWKADAFERFARRGDPVLMIRATDPDLLRDVDATRVSRANRAQQAGWRAWNELRNAGSNAWCIVAAPMPGWNDRVLHDVPAADREAAMWATLFAATRADRADPVAAWKEHLERLAAWARHLNDRRYTAVRFRGPGTDLEVGLADGHVWKSGGNTTNAGTTYTANIPTEEVYTAPHRARVNGFVSSTKPLVHAGTLIDGIRVNFRDGRITEASARTGEAALLGILDADDGARRLGEVALVPNSSPISRTGRLFYNTLFDENAASHIAVGRAYRDTVSGGTTMSADAFEAAGGNDSLMHVDWMIGSGEIDVDGVREDGSSEPVMRGGEWTF